MSQKKLTPKNGKDETSNPDVVTPISAETQRQINGKIRKAKDTTNLSQQFTIKFEIAAMLANFDPYSQIYYEELLVREKIFIRKELRDQLKALSPKPDPNSLKAPASASSPPTHDELAERWHKRYPLTRYGLGSFRRFVAGVWSPIKTEQVRQEIVSTLIEAKNERFEPTKARLDSVVEMARTMYRLDEDQWDIYPELVVCRNGTVNIRTGEVLPHDPQLYITSGMDFDFNPNAQAPGVKKYFQRLEMQIPGITPYLEEYLGYCLSKSVKFEMGLFLVGRPGCGKGTLITIFTRLLGDLAVSYGPREMAYPRFNNALLVGKTLAYCFEVGMDEKIPTGLLNSLISGETLHGEVKHEKPFQFRPFTKILYAMNALPKVNMNDGLRRRVQIIKFPPLPEADQDPDLKDSQIPNEAAGIFVMALRGYQRLIKRNRFEIPEAVAQATREFNQVVNSVAVFLETIYRRDPEGAVQAEPLYQEYVSWCRDNRYLPVTRQEFPHELERLGLVSTRPHNQRVWKGISRRDETQSSDSEAYNSESTEVQQP